MTNLFMKTGEVYVFTNGEYSDYQMVGHFKCLKDITIEEKNELVDLAKKQSTSSWDQQQRFIPLLVERGYMEDFDLREYHLGDYGRLDPK